MIVLDTNVISELMLENPQQTVLTRFNIQPTSSMFVTTITEAEILTGIALLPNGRRRNGLTVSADHVFTVLFTNRILDFDSNAAKNYADIYAQRYAVGRPINHADCQIAAIARS